MRKAFLFFMVLYLGYFTAKKIQRNSTEVAIKKVVSPLETHPYLLPSEKNDYNVLLYSKANGWVHTDAIAAAKEVFPRLAQKQGWKLIISDDSLVFNPAQLSYFDVVIWNNVTGQTLNKTQREAFKNYIETGGGFVGIHGAGDDSHQWEWYDKKVIRTLFSHHPMQPQFQVGTLNKVGDSLFPATNDFPDQWKWEEEWYVFFESPKLYGSTVLYNLDESKLVMVGEQEDKQWGMGENHPIVWYHCQKKGKVFYTAMGHKGTYYQDPLYQQLLVEAVEWAGNTSINCN